MNEQQTTVRVWDLATGTAQVLVGHRSGIRNVTFGPGQLVAAWPLLQRRYGALLLAGEHTDPWAGYMEGALRSGARVARTITG